MRFRFVVCTVDGAWHYSDNIDEAEIQKHLDENGGFIGRDIDGDKAYATTVDEALDFMTQFLKINRKLDTQTFNMEVSGKTRTFNVCHIIWWEIVREDPDNPWAT